MHVRSRGLRLFLSSLVAGSLVGCDPSSPGTVGTWRLGAPMLEVRSGHSLTLLPDGRVLAAGGVGRWADDDSATVSLTAELYDPVTGTWTPTGSMESPRAWHAAVLLADGRVLVTGGVRSIGAGARIEVGSSAELYDPASGHWSPTGAMGRPRPQPDALLLPGGQVLVGGGCRPDGTVEPVPERYDPASGTWADDGMLAFAQIGSMALLPASGQVLQAGGQTNECNNFNRAISRRVQPRDPATGTWRETGPLDFAVLGNTLSPLPNGKVLLTGGGRDQLQSKVGPAVLFDPATETWGPSGAMTWERGYASVVSLPSGRILVAGGNWIEEGREQAPAAEVYDAGADAWTPTPVMLHHVLGSAAAVTLLSGDVLFTGGQYFSASGPVFSSSAVQLFRE